MEREREIHRLARQWVAILRHPAAPVAGADLLYGMRTGVKVPPFGLNDPRAVKWIADQIAKQLAMQVDDMVREIVRRVVAAGLAGGAVMPSAAEEVPEVPVRDWDKAATITCLDLFSGSGGMSLGFQDAGYDIVAATDYDKDAGATYQKNFPEVKFIPGDIRTDGVKKEIVAAFAGRRCHVIIGGPECDAYSTAGKRDERDLRAELFRDYVACVALLKPICCVMENVPGLLSARTPGGKPGSRLTEIEAAFRGIGFQIQHRKFDSADFGTAQRRKRIIFIASGDKFAPIIFMRIPRPGAGLDAWGFTGVKRAIDDLKDVPDGQVQGHVRAKHGKRFLAKIRAARAAGKKQVGSYSETTRFADPGAPARTQKDNHGMCDIHYEQDRVLTPREQARLQGFPDSFEFCGSLSSMRKQVCNGVPSDLARAVATTLKPVIANALSMATINNAMIEATKTFGKRMGT